MAEVCLFEYSMPAFSLSCVRKLIVLVTILFLAVAFALFTYQRRPLEPHHLGWSEMRAKAVRPNFITEPKQLILYWGAPWNLKSYLPPDGSMTKDGCGVTHERGLLLEADAVVFHFTTITQAEIPWRFPRKANQTFIWWSAEPPAVLLVDYPIEWPAFDGFFNWTMTYRRDADVPIRYGSRGHVMRSLPRGKKVVDDIITGKEKLAVFIASRCNYTLGARMRTHYKEQLRAAGVHFDEYGKCFPDSKAIPHTAKEMQNLMRTYKFFFAFENSLHCRDYVTEKFWDNSLRSGAVPVVWGPTKDDLLAVAPLDSFIFVEDFESPTHLANYINFLDKHDNEYRKYFHWRENDSLSGLEMLKMTMKRYPSLHVLEEPKSLCQKLLERNETKVVGSLVTEFMQGNPIECTE